MTESVSPKQTQVATPPEKVEEAVIENDDKHKILASMKIQQWRAPLPPPDLFNKYSESIQDRMMTIVEKENDNRHAISKSRISESRLGQHYTFAIIIIALLVSTALILAGHTYGLIVPFIGIIPILGALLEKLKDLFSSKKSEES